MKNENLMFLVIILVIVFLVSRGETKPDTRMGDLNYTKAVLAHEIGYDISKQQKTIPEFKSLGLNKPFEKLDLDYVLDTETIKKTYAQTKFDACDVEVADLGCTPDTCEDCPLICKACEKVLIEVPDISDIKKEDSSQGLEVDCCSAETCVQCTSASYSGTYLGRNRIWRPFSRIQAWRDNNRARRSGTLTYQRAYRGF